MTIMEKQVDEVESLTRQVRSHLAQERTTAAGGDPGGFVAQVIASVVSDHAVNHLRHHGTPLSQGAAEELRRTLTANVRGAGGLEPLLADDSIEDIWCNGCDQVWVRRTDGSIHRVSEVAASDAELVELVRTLAAAGGQGEQERRWDRAAPILDLRLHDGSRLHAIMSVAARPSVSIRRHHHTRPTLDQLRQNGTFDLAVASLLQAAVDTRMNVIVAGRTGAGKTTLLRALASVIHPDERLVTIEDSLELGLDVNGRHHNVVALQSREANIEGQGAVGLRELFRAGLRMNPGRVIVGEVRGDESVSMLNAMSQGNDGSLSTIHSRSSAGVFSKLALYGAQTPERLGPDTMAALIAESIDLVIHMNQTPTGQRIVSSIREVTGAEATTVISNEIYRPGPDLAAVPAAPISQARIHRLHDAGYRPDKGGQP